MVIAIDGPGGVGKSTVTRALALRLGYDFLDTGATYRAATVAVLQAGIEPTDEDAVIACVHAIDSDYDDGLVYLNGDDVSVAVRSDAVTAAVSAVSAIPEVRSHIVERQRAWVRDRGGSAVVEGRDIGTVVFADAPVKVYLTARTEVRASRRAGDAEAEGKSVGDIRTDLDRRDRFDAGRAVSPMQAADDAVILDTSELTVAEVVTEILKLVERAQRRVSGGPM